MRVLFLDIDGVLNSQQWLTHLYHSGVRQQEKTDRERWVSYLNPDLVERLNRVLEETGAQVVVSSTWRMNHTREALQSILEEVGFRGKIIDFTPRNDEPPYTRRRGRQILHWMENVAPAFDVETIAIVDDDTDMEPYKHRFVKTWWEHGLQDEQAEALIQLLKE